MVAATALAHTPPPSTARERSAAATVASRAAAEALGNTPSVARSSYIDPRVLEQHARGETVPADAARSGLRAREESVRALLA